MKYSVANDARPQLKLLLVATAVSIALWIVSSFIFSWASYLVYPLQLFATFVHEGSHVLAALITGSHIESLTVSPDTSGEVFTSSGWLSGLLISSAGYLGTTAFGTLLLVWMRYGFSSKLALYISSGFVGIMTVVFGFLAPLWNIFSTKVTFGSVAFTVISGAVLTTGLFAIARYASLKWINFALSFLAIQCLLNAIFSLKDLAYLSAATNEHTDAGNMAAATGLPAIVWAFIWIGISILMISIGLRIYAVSQKSTNTELPFEDR